MSERGSGTRSVPTPLKVEVLEPEVSLSTGSMLVSRGDPSTLITDLVSPARLTEGMTSGDGRPVRMVAGS